MRESMQQTFYIGGDEEISSVIERLRKSLAGENFLVLPKRSLVMQSVVNLKLLKREADKMGKSITIVTQDDLSANIAARAGIMVRPTLEGLEAGKAEDSHAASKGYFFKEESSGTDSGDSVKKTRLQNMGSESFYGGGADASGGAVGIRISARPALPKRSVPSNQETARKTSRAESAPVRPMDAGTAPGHGGAKSSRWAGKLDPEKEKGLEKIFQAPKEEHVQLDLPAKGKAKKVMAGFFLLCLLAFASIAAYLFIPKAQIVVTLFSQKKKVDMEVSGIAGQAQADQEAKTIPMRIIEGREELSLEYESTGESDASGSKARGTIAIYNEYSSQPQTLVATTRFESADGKVFRLLKNAVVPGMSQVAGEAKPGVIEAEVVADEAGSAYNIGPAAFTIPGFKGSPKFEKFSAKSADSMAGGGSSGSADRTVTQRDIDSAKKETEAKLKEKIQALLESELKEGEVLADGAMQYAVSQSASDAKAGSLGGSFAYSAKAEAVAAVFLRKDAEELIVAEYEKRSGAQAGEIENIRIDYAGVTPDFEKKSLTMKLYGELSFMSVMDAEQFKKELLGKDESAIEQIAKKNPAIKNMTFEFTPKFVSRVPQYPERVSVEIKSEN